MCLRVVASKFHGTQLVGRERKGEDGVAWPVYTDHHASHTTELQPNLDDLPPRFVSAITSLLPLDLDVVIASPLVCDEKYWKRRALEERVRSKRT